MDFGEHPPPAGVLVGLILCWSCVCKSQLLGVSCVHLCTCALTSALLCQTLFHCGHPLPLALPVSLPPFQRWSVRLWWWQCDMDVVFRAKWSTVSYCLHVNRLWVSVLIIICWKKKLLSWCLSDVLIYRYFFFHDHILSIQFDVTHSWNWRLHLLMINIELGFCLPWYLVILFSSPSHMYLF